MKNFLHSIFKKTIPPSYTLPEKEVVSSYDVYMNSLRKRTECKIGENEKILFYTKDGYPIYKGHITCVWVYNEGNIYPSQIEYDFIPNINISPEFIYLIKENIKCQG